MRTEPGNTLPRRIVSAVAAVLGAYAGIWAAFWPADFYWSFPGLGLHWIDRDGEYYEHLIRDIGGLDLALTLATLTSMISRRVAAGRMVGLGWATLGVLHLYYHLRHPVGAMLDHLVENAGLGMSAIFGLLLVLLPAQATRRHVDCPDRMPQP